MKGMPIDHIEHVLNTYEQINCQSVFISFWYLGTSAYVPRGPRPLPQRFEVPTPHSEIRVSQYQVPMILRDIYLFIYLGILYIYIERESNIASGN